MCYFKGTKIFQLLRVDLIPWLKRRYRRARLEPEGPVIGISPQSLLKEKLK